MLQMPNQLHEGTHTTSLADSPLTTGWDCDNKPLLKFRVPGAFTGTDKVTAVFSRTDFFFQIEIGTLSISNAIMNGVARRYVNKLIQS